MKLDHSYEELRKAALDVLAGRTKYHRHADQYQGLMAAVECVFFEKEGRTREIQSVFSRSNHLSEKDRNLFLEVFWGLFREGVITLGKDDCNREFPFFRVSEFGKKILESGDLYFFHDVSSYEKLIVENIPQIKNTNLIYLKEAMQAFLSGCVLSSSVMLGVSIEDAFLNLLESVEKKPVYSEKFKKVFEERTLLRKFNKFNHILQQISKDLPPDIKENLETDFAGILNMIRNFRNDSGHPSGQIISREQCYILLQLFIPCCKKIYQLTDFFQK